MIRNRPGPAAIVTDGMFRKSLSAIRALGKAGYEVHVSGDSWLTVGFWSHFTHKRILTPDAKEDVDAFEQALIRSLETLRDRRPGQAKPVLLPMEDETFQFAVENRERLAELADMLLPSPEAFATCMNKGATMELAESLGVPHPRTEIAYSAAALLAAVERMQGQEFVIKPVQGSGSRGVRYNPRFSVAEAEAFVAQYGPALLQERIPPEGEAIGVSFLFDRTGAPIAHFCHKRLRQFPNSGGPSTDRVGVEADALVEMSRKLLQALAWKGVAMVEWKTDAGGRSPKLLEINPRFWGSLELAVRSGVDFPTLYARAAADQPPSALAPRIGVRCRWLIPGDILRWFTAKPGERESFGAFCSSLGLVEEWDSRDVSGFFSCILCQGLAFFRPKYFKLLRR